MTERMTLEVITPTQTPTFEQELFVLALFFAQAVVVAFIRYHHLRYINNKRVKAMRIMLGLERLGTAMVFTDLILLLGPRDTQTFNAGCVASVINVALLFYMSFAVVYYYHYVDPV